LEFLLFGGKDFVNFRIALFLVVVLVRWTSFAQDSATPPQNTPVPTQKKGAITGTISDKTGTGIPGAMVKVTSASGTVFTATTDDKGLYAITELPPDSYRVTVEARGAKVFEASMAVGGGQVLTLSVSGEGAAEPSANTRTPSESPVSGATPNQTESTPQLVAPTPVLPKGPADIHAPGVANPEGASISGTVNDQSGAVIVGAEIKVTDSKGAIRTSVSDSQGNYSIKGLPPGTYRISVAAKGFKTFETENITITAGSEVPLDASLEPGQAATEVNVEGTKVAEVETENANVSGTITQKEVVKIGLNGRNFTQLIALTPGVSNQTGQDEAKVGVTGSVKYSVNGGRVEYNTFDVDGSDVLNAGLNGAESTLIVYPSLDAIQEVKVLTSNFGAMYGRTASGQVLVTTKEGGKQFHGNGYEFIRNEFFNARNYFDQTTKAPLYRRNDFGLTFGGPLFIPGIYNTHKDKAYFFVSEEFHYEKTPVEYNAAVPTLAERAGNFSDVCPLSFGSSVPFSRSQYPDCPQASPGQTFVNNTVIQPQVGTIAGSSAIDANALAILNTNLVPLPNAASGCNSSLVGHTDPQTGNPVIPCYVATLSPATYWREDLFRFDENPTPKMSAMFRYIHDSWDTTVLTPQWGAVRNTFPTVQNRFLGPGTSLALRVTNTFSPSLLNEFVASYADSHITLTNQNGPGGASYRRPGGLSFTPGTLDAVSGRPQYPMGYLFNNGFGAKVPGIVIGGNNAEYGGNGFAVDPSYMPWEHTSPTLQWRDNLSKQWRRHILQFGVQYVYAQKNELNGAIGAATGDLQGVLTFNNINQGYQGNGTGNAFANFLTQTSDVSTPRNAIASFTQDSAQLRYYNRYTIAEPYFQDDWKVTRRLTLNLGLRLSLFGTYHEKYLRAYNFVPSAYSVALATQLRVDPNSGILLNSTGKKPIPLNLNNLDPRLTNGLVLCGVNGVPAGCMKDHLFNYAPRFGFAWDPRGDGKTSIRGGYGIFYEHGTGNEANSGSLEASAPLVVSMTQRFPANYACIGGVGFVPDASGANCPVAPGAYPFNITSIPTTAIWPYAQQWSFSVQRELPKDLVATIAYVGSKGTNLTVQRQINQLHPVPAKLNPFAIHEPIIASVSSNSGDCSGYGGDPSQGGSGTFTLLNGIVVGNRDAAYTNLEVACQGILGSGTTPPDVNTFRPYLGFAQIYSLQNGANSAYHALQATLRRTRGPLTLGVSYTYSHSIDEASDRSDTTFVNSYDLGSNRASSDFDQRHLLSVSYVYKLPNFGRSFAEWTSTEPDGQSSGTPDPSAVVGLKLFQILFDNWEWSGVTVFQSGTPFSVVNGGGNNSIGLSDNAGVANGIGPSSYPDIVRGAIAPNSSKNSGSFGPLLSNPSEFVAPRGLTFGNAGRNFLNNPHRLNVDMALLKHFRVRENSELELRAEAFNLFNHTQLRIFDPNNPGNSGNNVINCYGGPSYSAGYKGPETDCLTGNSFLHPVDAHRPRTVQFGVKFSF
jgi:hypothetical protein